MMYQVHSVNIGADRIERVSDSVWRIHSFTKNCEEKIMKFVQLLMLQIVSYLSVGSSEKSVITQHYFNWNAIRSSQYV